VGGLPGDSSRRAQLRYAPSDACRPATQTVSGTFAQRTHLERLLLARKHPDYCDDDAAFIGKILADIHRHFGLVLPAVTPQNLPYSILGPLFRAARCFSRNSFQSSSRQADVVVVITAGCR